MRLKSFILCLLFGLSLVFSKNIDTLYVVKNHEITAKYSLKKRY